MNQNTGALEHVLNELRANNYEHLASILASHAIGLQSDDAETKAIAAREIEGLCHVRSLGDLNMVGQDGNEWNRLLGKLARYARKKANG